LAFIILNYFAKIIFKIRILKIADKVITIKKSLLFEGRDLTIVLVFFTA